LESVDFDEEEPASAHEDNEYDQMRKYIREAVLDN
jgi:hypothetical protein